MPTKREDKHLDEIPDKGQSIMQGIVDTLMPLCPNCRIDVLAFVCAALCKQINSEQQQDYFKELMRVSYYTLHNMGETPNAEETIH